LILKSRQFMQVFNYSESIMEYFATGLLAGKYIKNNYSLRTDRTE